MISTIIMMIIIISSSNSGIIFSFYGFVKLLLMQSLHSCFPRAATVQQVPICCWVDSEWVINHWLYVGLESWSLHQVASALTAKLLAH